MVLYNHFVFELPQMLAFDPMAVAVGMKTYEVPLPSLTTMAWQIALFFFVEGEIGSVMARWNHPVLANGEGLTVFRHVALLWPPRVPRRVPIYQDPQTAPYVHSALWSGC